MLESHIEKLLAIVVTSLLAIGPPVRGNESTTRVQGAEAAARIALLRQYASDMAWPKSLGNWVSWMARWRCWNDRPTGEAEVVGGIEDYRGIEWHLLWQLTHAEKQVLVNESRPVRALAFLPDDSQLIAGDGSYTYASPGVLHSPWNLNAATSQPTDESNKAIWTQEMLSPLPTLTSRV